MTDPRALKYCEIDISPCTLTYGTLPCAAVLGETGPIKCFNTRFTCQDPDNFTPGLVTLRFAVDTGYLPVDIPAIPSLLRVEYTPGRIAPGKDLGQRATVRFTFKDHPWSDTGPGYDKYVSERPYVPFDQGTYWGKLRARWLSLQGQAIRLIDGFLGQTLGEMVTRHFIIDGFEQPSRDTFIVIAKDILKLTDGDKSLTPPLSNGFLVADINASQTSAVLAPSGIGAEYPASGHVTISGNETCAFTRSGDTLTLTRGQKGTVAVAHNAEDRVQLMRSWVAQPPSVIFKNLFQDDAKIDPSWTPVSEWEDEEQTNLQLSYTRDVAEPTATSKIAADLIQQAGLVVWVDPISRKIKMKVLGPVPATAAVLSPETIIEKSYSVREQADTRISQVHVRYGLRNPLLRTDDRLSYRSVFKGVDATSDLYWTSPAIKEVNGTFLPPFAVTTAQRTSDVLLGRYTNPPRLHTFALSRLGGLIPQEAQTLRLKWPDVTTQDATGATLDVPIMVTRVDATGRRIEVEAEEMFAKTKDPADLKNRVLLVNTNETNLVVKTMHDAAYPPLTDEDVADGVNLTVIVESAATVSSNVAGRAGIALDFGPSGTWPEGLPIRVRIVGAVRGAGGNGGSGGNQNSADATFGIAGGTAIRTRHALSIELLATGQIKGGGGGGGGGASYSGVLQGRVYYVPGGGGGGGAGIGAGTGGSGGYGYQSATPGNAGASEAGGVGGRSGKGEVNGSPWPPTTPPPITGGTGGAPGAPGGAGLSSGSPAGGAAGYSIDGISYCTFDINLGVIAGPQVN